MSDRISGGCGVQDTGNPVFDATVNIAMNMALSPNDKHLDMIHAKLLELYEKEPKPTQYANESQSG